MKKKISYKELGINGFEEFFSSKAMKKFILGGKNSKKSFACAKRGFLRSAQDPFCHGIFLRKQLIDNKTTTLPLWEWVVEWFEQFNSKISSQWERKEYEWQRKKLGVNYTQKVFFLGKDKGIKKITGFTMAKGAVGWVFEDEPIDVDDVGARLKIDNNKDERDDKIMFNSLSRKALELGMQFEWIKAMNPHMDNYWIFQKFFLHYFLTKWSEDEIIEKLEDEGKICLEVWDSANPTGVFLQIINYKHNEFITNIEKREIEADRIHNWEYYVQMHLGWILKSSAGIYFDLVDKVKLVDKEDLKKMKNNLNSEFSTGLDFGITAGTTVCFGGYDFLRQKIVILDWKEIEADKRKLDKADGKGKMKREEDLAYAVSWKHIDDYSNEFPIIKYKRNHWVKIDMQHPEFIFWLEKYRNGIASFKQERYDWLRFELQGKKYDFGEKARVRIIRMLLSGGFIEFTNKSKETADYVFKNDTFDDKGKPDPKKQKIRDLMDALWYFLVDYLELIFDEREIINLSKNFESFETPKIG